MERFPGEGLGSTSGQLAESLQLVTLCAGSTGASRGGAESAAQRFGLPFADVLALMGRFGRLVEHAAVWFPLLFGLVCAAFSGSATLCLGDHDHFLGAFSLSWLTAWVLEPFVSSTYCVTRGSGGRQTVLAAALLVLWYLGLTTSIAPSEEGWSVAMTIRSVAFGVGRQRISPLPLPAPPQMFALPDFPSAEVGRRAFVGMFLLEDILRAVFGFLAQAPWEAWPLARSSHRTYSVWISDNRWWEDCYLRVEWMKLPPNLRHLTGHWYPSLGDIVNLAASIFSVLVEACGTWVVFPPECNLACWVAAPLLTSTILVASQCRRMPKRPDALLFAVLDMVRLAGKCGVYFHAAWLLTVGLLASQRGADMEADLPHLRIPDGCGGWEGEWDRDATLGALEVIAISILYVVLACHLWVIFAWFRTSEPLYAVPIESDIAPSSAQLGDPPPASTGRPLYCRGAGCGVEGTFAPTRMCDWDELDASGLVTLNWRDRYRIRSQAEVLTAREARFLSFLDALNTRIREAEQNTNHCRCITETVCECLLATTAGLLALCTWRQLYLAARSGPTGFLEAAFCCALLARGAYRLHQLLLWGFGIWRQCGSEASALRCQARALQQELAETQMQLHDLEAHLESLGVRALRRDRGTLTPILALQPLALSWLLSILAIVFHAMSPGKVADACVENAVA